MALGNQNSFDSVPLFGIVEAMQEQVDSLRTGIYAAKDPDTRHAMRVEASAISEEMVQLGALPELQDDVFALGRRATEAIVDLHQNRAKLKKADFEASEDAHLQTLSRVRDFFDRYGEEDSRSLESNAYYAAGGMAVASVAKLMQPFSAAEDERSHLRPYNRRFVRGKYVEAHLYDNAILLGEEHQRIEFNADKRGNTTIFGERCQAVLGVLLKTKDRPISSRDIWTVLYGEACPYDSPTITPAIRWVERNVKVNDTSLIEHSGGRRGPSARYRLNPELNVEHHQFTGVHEVRNAGGSTKCAEDAKIEPEADNKRASAVLVQNQGYLAIAFNRFYESSAALEEHDIRPPSMVELKQLAKNLPKDLKQQPYPEQDAYKLNAMHAVSEALLDEYEFAKLTVMAKGNDSIATFISYIDEHAATREQKDALGNLLTMTWNTTGNIGKDGLVHNLQRKLM